jgi:hypothetical protein
MKRSIPVAAAALAAATVSACGDPPTVALEVTTGQEKGVLSLDPAVASVEIVATGTDEDGTLTLKATAAPGGEFDLGEVPDTAIMTFDLTGKAADGTVVARGRSVSIPVGGVEADVISLFIQRLGEFARPPGELVRAHVHPPAGVLTERYLIVTGGDAAFGDDGPADAALGDFYDLMSLGGSESSAALPRAAKSLVTRGTRLVLIDDAGASYADLDLGATGELVAPEGLTFAEVSGGVTLELPTGANLVVGATRPEGPTTGVLAVADGSTLSTVRLATPRAGSAAAYVEGVGLVVAGGSPEGAGLEVIRDDLTVAPLPFPADPVAGAAAVTIGEQQLALVGGTTPDGMPAPMRIFDLRCAVECAPQSFTLDLPIATRGRGYLVSSGVLVVGDAVSGETLAFHVAFGDPVVTPLAFKEPRFGASPVAAPNGTLAVVGGVTAEGAPVRSVEVFFPE